MKNKANKWYNGLSVDQRNICSQEFYRMDYSDCDSDMVVDMYKDYLDSGRLYVKLEEAKHKVFVGAKEQLPTLGGMKELLVDANKYFMAGDKHIA